MIICLLVFGIFFSSMVLADELSDCKNDCNINTEGDLQVSCISECEGLYGAKEENLYEGYEDAEIEESAGTVPGDTFYFIDKFFDKFGDGLTVKEERIAEIKELIEAGDIERAKQVLEDYMNLADELEHEIDPERKEDAKRSAAAIRNAMKDIRDQLPPGERGKFVSEIRSKEHSIATAAEIAGKIKELCIQLAELDPVEYSRMCRTDDDAPKWQKKLDEDLSEDQRKIAKNFVGIMKECFESSGQECRCEEIPFADFADACSQAAPLATACDIKKDERACEKLDKIQMPELPDWLQDIWEDLEKDVKEAQFDLHMPRECVEAGATTAKECGKIMIENNAPEECKQPLLDSGCEDERECREICDKIMFELHSPQECIEKGITDLKDCAHFMDSFRGERGPIENMGPGLTICKEIEDPTKRLECFDHASSQTMSAHKGFNDEGYEGPCMTEGDWKAKKEECRALYGDSAGDEAIYGDSGEGYECTIGAKCVDFSQGKLNFEEIKDKERECAEKCKSEGRPWDFSYGECVCKEIEHLAGCEAKLCPEGTYCEYGECKEYENNEPEGVTCDDCSNKCAATPSGQRLKGTGCGPSGCECYYESAEPQYEEGQGHGEPVEYNEPVESVTDSGSSSSESSPTTTSTETSTTVTESSTSEPSSSESSTSESTSTDTSAEITGAAISGNAFLEYYHSR